MPPGTSPKGHARSVHEERCTSHGDRRESSSRSRRTYLHALGTGSILAIAGCLGGAGDEDGDGAPSDDHDDHEDDTLGDEFIEYDEDPTELVDVPEEVSCAVCNMIPAETTDWNSQAAHEDGVRAFLCTPGCAVAYSVKPTAFGGPETPLAAAWVRELEDRELLSVEEAYYALDDSPDRDADNPMVNPATYRDRESAVAYVERYDDLSEEDVIHGSDLDEDAASRFRDIEFYREQRT